MLTVHYVNQVIFPIQRYQLGNQCIQIKTYTVQYMYICIYTVQCIMYIPVHDACICSIRINPKSVTNVCTVYRLNSQVTWKLVPKSYFAKPNASVTSKLVQ